MAALTSVALGVGAAASAGGAIAQGVAAGEAAGAQQEAQRRMRKEAKRAAKPSAQELALLDRQLKVTEQGIERQQRLLAAVDPALMEAGKQALQLLGGQEAGVLAPLRGERERQRRALEGQLREQLGSGFANSSAGIEALSRFDAQSQLAFQGAQQQALGALLGQANQTVAGSGAGFESAQALGLPLHGQQVIAQRRLQAALGSPEQGISPGAASGMAFGQSAQAFGSGLAGLGGQLIGQQGQRDMVRDIFEQQRVAPRGNQAGEPFGLPGIA